MSSITVSVWSPPVCGRPGRDAGGSEEKPEVTPASTFCLSVFFFCLKCTYIIKNLFETCLVFREKSISSNRSHQAYVL